MFTDIDVQVGYFLDMIKRQAIVNAGVKFVFRNRAEAAALRNRLF